MAGEVDEDVDAVGMHLRRRCFVIDAVDAAPGLAAGLDAARHRVVGAGIGIHEEFDSTLRLCGQGGEHALGEIADRMFAQVARYQPDAQGSARAARPGLA